VSDLNDVIGEIMDEIQRVTDSGGKGLKIVIRDAGLWARLPELAGASYQSVPGNSLLFSIPVCLGSKIPPKKFTVEAEAWEVGS
jgi:hypothetical protein